MKKRLSVGAAAVLGALSLCSGADIWMAGDSTMPDYPESRSPLSGWGASLGKWCKPGVVIHNRALGGKSSKSFMTEKHWEKIIDEAKPGDFVIIQFGHNDGVLGVKNRYRFTDAEKTFPLYLEAYIEEARLYGLRPVLLTQTVYCGFGPDGKVRNFEDRSEAIGGDTYVAACRRVAAKTGVDFVDVNAETLRRLDAMDRDEIVKLYMTLAPGESPNYPQGRKDMVHLRGAGADFYAGLFVELAKKRKLAIAELFN